MAFEDGPRIGAGGMAEVFRGSVEGDPGRAVAIKVPAPGLPAEIRDLFLREAEAAQRVASPYVVRVLDWGDSPAFIAFEFIEGGTLADELRRRRLNDEFWSETQLVRLFSQLAEAMSAINEQVLHRDLKPENIFVDGSLLRVSDFGISKFVGEATRTRTFKGAGTPAYMAPETFRADSVDWRSDQYSLGVVFFEMAAGELPFRGDPDELEQKHLYERPARVSEMASGTSERLATLISRMLEKQPDIRFLSWGSVLEELKRLSEAAQEVDSANGDDPLAKEAARSLERLRAERLDNQRLEDTRRRAEQDRSELVAYWSGALFDQLGARVKALNDSLGEQAVEFWQGDDLRGVLGGPLGGAKVCMAVNRHYL